jgi:TolB protein
MDFLLGSRTKSASERTLKLLISVAACIVCLSTARVVAAPLTLPYQLTHSQNMDPAPNPDGTRLVYISVTAGKEQLFTMNADASAQIQITRDDADHEDPAWSPDGKHIAFVLISKTEERIYVINPDGSGSQAVSPTDVRAIHPAWSNDSRKIIYCTDDDLKPPRKNDSDIDVADLASGKITTLITGGVNTFPTGRRI